MHMNNAARVGNFQYKQSLMQKERQFGYQGLELYSACGNEKPGNDVRDITAIL